MSSILFSNLNKNKILELLKTDERIDGRKLSEYRKYSVEVGTIEKAEGSAKVTLGNTKVLVGIKISIGTPFSDKPNDGVLTVNSEFVPLASPKFESGPPKEDSIELSRVVDRGIRESHAINLEKLCIIPGKKVFIVFIDIYILNHDGNLIDAAALAAIAALANTKVFKYELKDEEVIIKSGFSDLPITDYPIAITSIKIKDKILLDPSVFEEKIMDSRLTICFNKDGDICAIQKGEEGALLPKNIFDMVKLAQEKSREIRKLVVKNNGSKKT